MGIGRAAPWAYCGVACTVFWMCGADHVCNHCRSIINGVPCVECGVCPLRIVSSPPFWITRPEPSRSEFYSKFLTRLSAAPPHRAIMYDDSAPYCPWARGNIIFRHVYSHTADLGSRASGLSALPPASAGLEGRAHVTARRYQHPHRYLPCSPDGDSSDSALHSDFVNSKSGYTYY